MAFSFESWVGQYGILGQAGLYHVVLPFLLLFVIIYGLLSMIGIFGSDSGDAGKRGKKINGVISLILALFITYSTSYLVWFANFVSNMTGFMAIILICFLFFAMIYAMGTKGGSVTDLWKDNKGKWIVLIVAVLIVYFVFMASGGGDAFGFAGLNIRLPHVSISAQTIIMFIIVVGLVLLVVGATFGFDWLKGLFKGGGTGPGGGNGGGSD